MNYAPQSWLADWSAMTDALTKGEQQMKGMHHEEYIDENEEVSLLDGEFDRNCSVCGRRFITTRRQGFMCPECRGWKRHEAGVRGGKNAQETWKRKHGGGTPHDVKAADVPDVPPDESLYYSEADKIKKTAPIEAHLGPYKPKEGEIDMDLSKFPSGSNRLEHPENFTQAVETEDHNDKLRAVGDAVRAAIKAASKPDTGSVTDVAATVKAPEDAPKSADAARMERHKMLKALAMDKRGAIMSLYSTVCDISGAIETPVAELLDRLTRIDAALN